MVNYNINIISKYFQNLTNDQINKLEKLESLYKNWNNKINVISRKDIDDLYLKHVLHSLSIAKLISFNFSLLRKRRLQSMLRLARNRWKNTILSNC